jgi:6-phosphogluconolactonase
MACFAEEADSGALPPVGRVPPEPLPRAYGIDPTGHLLYSAGLESGRLVAFGIDQQAGTLTPLDVYPVGERPMWVTILNL